MANRRMFSKNITDTDLFLDMPMSTQCLYFHLNMSADDDGFIGNAKTIRRMVGASEDDLKLLIAKEFIFPFESGVVVIRDWKIHNYIRKDRYSETVYQEEKAQIVENENGRYVIGTNNGIPTVDQRLPQVRLGKVRIGKVRQGKYRVGKSKDNNSDDDFIHDNDNSRPEEDDEIDIETEDINTDESVDINIHRFYQDNFGMQTSYIVEDLEMWVDDLSKEVVLLALQKTVENGSPYSYAKGIMTNWAKKDIKTVDAAKAESLSRSKQNNWRKGSKTRSESTPAWAKEDAEQVKDEKLSPEEEAEFKKQLAEIRAMKSGKG